jgi:hypothetical protein
VQQAPKDAALKAKGLDPEAATSCTISAVRPDEIDQCEDEAAVVTNMVWTISSPANNNIVLFHSLCLSSLPTFLYSGD